MRYIYLFVLIFSCSKCSRNTADKYNEKKDSITYLNNAIEFISQVYSMDSSFVLEDAVEVIPENLLKGILTKDDFFNATEKDDVQFEKYPSMQVWRQNFFPRVRIVNRHSVDSVLQSMDHVTRWDYIHSKLGGSITSFSYPIFLRNYSYCLFYCKNYINGIGEGNLILYKKEKGKWVEYKYMGGWIT